MRTTLLAFEANEPIGMSLVYGVDKKTGAQPGMGLWPRLGVLLISPPRAVCERRRWERSPKNPLQFREGNRNLSRRRRNGTQVKLQWFVLHWHRCLVLAHSNVHNEGRAPLLRASLSIVGLGSMLSFSPTSLCEKLAEVASRGEIPLSCRINIRFASRTHLQLEPRHFKPFAFE